MPSSTGVRHAWRSACRHEKLVAFSCKRRGFCPSCGARRMAETAAHLVEHVLPQQSIRQWVLSFPYPLRFLFATRPADEENPSPDIEPTDDFEQLLAAAVHYRIATGPHAGRNALTLRTADSSPPPDNPGIAQLSGCSLHAGTVCEAHERDALERLCRYIARPAVSNEQGASSTSTSNTVACVAARCASSRASRPPLKCRSLRELAHSSRRS